MRRRLLGRGSGAAPGVRGRPRGGGDRRPLCGGAPLAPPGTAPPAVHLAVPHPW